MIFISRCLLYCVAAAGLVSASAHATIVRMDLAIGQQSSSSVYIQLYDTQAPVTVANFLNYIENASSGERRYDNTFIHRTVPDFIIQGGGFAYDPGLGEFSVDTALHINEDDPIINEFDVLRSNVRGTIAMAKLGNDPDSATSEWFFNLADNSANLDSQNGGFTVFGEVLGNGMAVIDAIAVLPRSNQGGAFQDLPVVDLAAGAAVAEQNLVRITSMVVNPPESLSADIVDHDFGLALVSTSRRVTITLLNTGSTDLTIDALGGVNPLAAPFSFDAANDSCSMRTLVSGDSCVFDVVFSPTAEGLASDSFSVESSDIVLPELTIQVRGDGAPATPTLEVSPTTLDLKNVGTGEPVQRTITVRNVGGGALLPGEPGIGGANAAAVNLDGGCAQQSLAFEESCSITMTLTAPSVGDYSATITVNADPGMQSVPVAVTATATLLEPEIRGPVEIDMGDTVNGQDVSLLVSFENIGIDALYASDIQFVGENSALFSTTDTCVGVVVDAGFRCTGRVTFLPVSELPGEIRSTLRIYSNDPNTPELDIPIVVTVSSDNDGIPDAVEAAGSNGGDGNQDGVPDDRQDNVASLPSADGGYVAIASPDGTTLRGVSISELSPASDGGLPSVGVSGASLEFRKGFFSFTVEGVPVGGTVAVAFHFPTDQSENSYFKYGRLPGELAFLFPEHWYLFDFKEDSGTGATFNGNVITLYLTDGGRGDSDQLEDGRIVDPGGPAIAALADSGSSGGGCSMSRGSSGGSALDLVWLLASMLLLRVRVVFYTSGVMQKVLL